jgi:diguanylate cyclase (GGDEF)-like protein
MQLRDLVDEVDAVRLQQAVEQADEGRTVTLEVQLKTIDGILVHYLVSTTAISRSHGGGMAVVGVGFDITDRKELETELERQASIDYLTGAYNRRKLLTFLKIECARVLRYGRSLALLMFDIDHFKSINDTHGHDVGDRVLCEIVRRAQACLRQSDVFARWGGEEFSVLVPESKIESAALLAEKLRIAVRQTPIDIAGTVTASFGVVEYRNSESVDELIRRADQALYRAKSGGRDRVDAGDS